MPALALHSYDEASEIAESDLRLCQSTVSALRRHHEAAEELE